MHRLVRSLSLLLVIAALGVSTGVAQPAGVAATSLSASAAAQDDATLPRAALDRETHALKSMTRAEIKRAMLNRVEQGPGLVAQTSTVALDLRSSAPGPLSGAQANGNRKVYYIVGGVLVAGGLVAGILALGDGGGGGGGGGAGIPPPPGRP